MAAQPIYPNEFNEGMNILYKDITRHLDARFEAINRQNMAERSETQKRFENMACSKRCVMVSQPKQNDTMNSW